jgi:hypothetical membrane protein
MLRTVVLRFLLAAGLAGPPAYFVLLTVLGLLWDGYSPVRDTMSELGAAGSPYRTLMNVAGFMGLGVVVLLFGAAYFMATQRSLSSALVVACLAVAGSFMIAVGFFPCDPGCVDVTTTGKLHSLTSVPQAIALPLAAVASSSVFLRDDRFGSGWALWSFWTGALALASGPVMSLETAQPVIGLLQRTGIGLSLAWVTAVSSRLLARPRFNGPPRALRSGASAART